MYIHNTIKNLLINKNYYLAHYNNNIYCYNVKKINYLSKDKIILTLNDKKIDILGEKFKIIKLTKEEILINGDIKEVKFYE